jgi:hypothetical protein
MDCSEKVVRPDGDDGDGQSGYGYNGTLTLAEGFSTPCTELPTNSIGVPPSSIYMAQKEGTLSGFENCVFYNNKDYADFNTFGQTNAALNNIVEPASMPIANIVRSGVINVAGKDVNPVVSLDPCAANDAVDMGASVPADSFFTAVNYAGGFAPNNNWLLGWTAADQYGLIDSTSHVAPEASITLGGVSISFQSVAGVEYKVQAATSPDFSDAADVAEVTGDGSVMSYTDAALETSKFFRVVYN